MTLIDLDRRMLQAVRPLELAAYLHAHGWQPDPKFAGKGAAWVNRDRDGEYEILLPLTNELSDYSIRLREALQTLALFEQRPVNQVWEDVTTTNADVLRVRIERSDALDGSLPLVAAVNMGCGLRDLLMAAACAAIEPAASFHEPWPARVADFLGRLRFRSENDRDPFTVALASRVPPLLASTTNGASGEEPFERRVLVLLARGLVAAREAAARMAARQAEAFEQAVVQGVSTNLCRALALMAGDLERLSLLRFVFSWSPNRPLAAEIPRSVAFAPDSLALLAEMGQSPRPILLQDSFELRGPIVLAQREPGAATGVVAVRGLVSGKMRRVRVALAGAELDQALQAFQQGRPVGCRGRLVREGRSLLLLQPRLLELVSSDAPG